MKKQTLLLFIFYIGCIFSSTTDELCPNTGDPFSDSPFKSPKSIFINLELTETFANPSSDLEVRELTDIFTAPSSTLNENELSDAFINPDSQFINLNSSDLNTLNVLSASILECKDDYSFWVGIHCDNINDIAGFQFELPNNLELLDVEGVRSDESSFQLHHNDNGLILGFSMSGDSIPPLSYVSDQDQSIIVKLHVKADMNSLFSFPIKSILAGPKGEKLSFKYLQDTLLLKNESVIISFVE